MGFLGYEHTSLQLVAGERLLVVHLHNHVIHVHCQTAHVQWDYVGPNFKVLSWMESNLPFTFTAFAKDVFF